MNRLLKGGTLVHAQGEPSIADILVVNGSILTIAPDLSLKEIGRAHV